MKKLLILAGLFFSASVIYSQVGIGTTTPNPSSLLDVSATDKGILIPQVSLSDVSDTMLDGTNTAATGLLIYNTNAATTGGSGVGYYYFNGTTWERLSTSASGGDDDFYEEGTTTPPDDINDDIYTLGNVAIGKNTADYRLDIEETTGNRALNININGTSNNSFSGIYLENSNTGTAPHYGLFSSLSGAGTGVQQGITSEITNSGDDSHYGFRNYLDGTGSGNHYGLYTHIVGAGTGNQFGTYNLMNNTGATLMYGTYNAFTSNSNAARTGSFTILGGTGTGAQTGYRVDIGMANNSNSLAFSSVLSGASNANQTGMSSLVTNTGTGTKTGIRFDVDGDNGIVYGIDNEFSGTSTSNTYGLRNLISRVSTSDTYGAYTQFSGNNAGDQYGTYNDFQTTNNSAEKYGLYNNFSTTNVGLQFVGVRNIMSNGAASLRYGVYNTISSSIGGVYYGTRNELGGGSSLYGTFSSLITSGAGPSYGSYITMGGSGFGNHFGSYHWIDPNGIGVQYGVYSEVLRSTGTTYAAFFAGNVAIGTEAYTSGTPNYYILPPSRGTVDQVMQTDGAGNVTWVDASSLPINVKIDDLTDGKSDNDGSQDGSSIFLGISAGQNDDSSNNQNIGVGFQSLMSNTGGFGNSALGYRSLENTTNSNGNVAVGYYSLFASSTGHYNTALGTDAIRSNQDGDYNSGIGSAALYDNTDGTGNIAVGTAAAGDNTTGNYNVALGYHALRTNVTGSQNVALGYQAGYNETGSHRLYIDNSSTTTPLIYGEFDTDLLRVNGDFEVVTGRAEFTNTGDATGTAGSGVVEIANTLRLDGDEIITNTGTTLYLNYDNNGDIIMDNTTFILDASTNNIGVGTPTPSTSFHVNHPLGTTNGLSISNATDADRWHFYTFSSNDLNLYFNNAARGSFDDVTGNYTALSDRNMKTNISEIETVLENVKELKVVDYNFKDQKNTKKYLGFIAQDVEKVFPQLVKKPSYSSGEESPYMMDYSGFGTIAIKAIQEQQEIIEAQKAKIEALERDIAEIKAILKKD